MKRCPNCNQSFSDENSFCLSDGTPLVSDAAEVPTVIRPSPVFQQPVQPVRQGVNPLFAYLAIALFALIAGGAIVAYLKSDSGVPSNSSAQQKNEPPTTAQQNVALNTVVTKESPSNRNVEVVQYPDSKPQPLTAEAVRNLLSVWERAQENKSFANYQACYDSSFAGVKTIKNGKSQTYSYNGWMADRRRMIANAVNLNLDISNLQIRVEGDTAIAEFDQYYRSLRYSDSDPKRFGSR